MHLMQQLRLPMAANFTTPQKQSASAFWKAYFAKFRRRVEDHEVSETGSVVLSAEPLTPLPFPDRRRSRLQRHSLLR
jgi:hypothetical protein